MDLGLRGRVVLVTGGSKGIGLACAQAFLAEGAKVVIASRQQAHLDAALATLQAQGAAPGSCAAISADLSDARSAEQMVARAEAALGPIDVLVNSAGAARRSPPEELTAEHWHAAMDAKFFTYVHAMQAVSAGMKARRRGAIVNIIGMGGKLPTPVHLPGGAANAALMLASSGLAQALAGHGIRVNAINPGLVATSRMIEGFEAQARMGAGSVEALIDKATRAAPLGRLCQAEDVAAVAVFLASDKAAYVSGAIVSVDGAASAAVV